MIWAEYVNANSQLDSSTRLKRKLSDTLTPEVAATVRDYHVHQVIYWIWQLNVSAPSGVRTLVRLYLSVGGGSKISFRERFKIVKIAIVLVVCVYTAELLRVLYIKWPCESNDLVLESVDIYVIVLW